MKKELVFSLSALVMMFSLLLVPSHRAYADDNKITITGTVADIKANPLQGVAVLVKGTTIGVETDASGRYSLTFAAGAEGSVLEFSSIGYKLVEKTCTKTSHWKRMSISSLPWSLPVSRTSSRSPSPETP